MSFGYSWKERLIHRIKSFFWKFFFITIIISGSSIYFLKSDFGNGVQFIKDLKDQINHSISQSYEKESTAFSNAIREDLGMKTIPTESSNNISSPSLPKPENNTVKPPVITTPIASQPQSTPVSNPPATNVDNNKTSLNDSSDSNKEINSSGFETYKIPFYYDNSNAPKNVSKEDALKVIQQASQRWTDACGVVFEYKGDKLADYVDNNKTISGKIGIIKWETQLEGNAIGEAHVGNSQGPAPGFVLALYSDFFAKNKTDLINTVTHEMGHVIGLEHSANKHSIMFPSEHPSASLQESDKAMCRYFRFRWSGMSQKQAQDKTGVLSNGGYNGNGQTEESDDN